MQNAGFEQALSGRIDLAVRIPNHDEELRRYRLTGRGDGYFVCELLYRSDSSAGQEMMRGVRASSNRIEST